jgi:hypothetical protein
MKAWILFFLGTLAFFLYKYLTRKDKSTKLSPIFWWRDNYPELLFSFVIDLAVMLIFIDPETKVDLSQIAWFPKWLVLPVKLAGSFLIGYGGGVAVYNIFKRKVKYETDKKRTG